MGDCFLIALSHVYYYSFYVFWLPYADLLILSNIHGIFSPCVWTSTHISFQTHPSPSLLSYFKRFHSFANHPFIHVDVISRWSLNTFCLRFSSIHLRTEAATWGVLWKKVSLKISRKIPVLEPLFFTKIAGLKPATLLKKRRQYRCFPVKFLKF